MIEIAAATSDNSTIWGDLAVAAFGALVAALLLWGVGYRLTFMWEDRKRRRELDLAAVETFYRLYGEFFAAWKLWDSHERKGVPGKGEPRELQWELLEQVERAEGGFEALLIKLASERVLDDTDKVLLGCFREGSQMLRETIRAGQALEWWATDKPGRGDGFRQYRAYKALAESIALKLEEGPARRRVLGFWPITEIKRPERPDAIRALLDITDASKRRGRWWKDAGVRLGLGGVDTTTLKQNRALASGVIQAAHASGARSLSISSPRTTRRPRFTPIIRITIFSLI